MPMMFGYNSTYGVWGILMMLISAGLFGYIVYWAVFSGVKNAIKVSNNKEDSKK
ncbi:hypothetical protein Dtox_3865 [Desulfofarcimen acetoxidans DSM 771]|uniref:DUF3149 domain-containing protein n=1 Tax=Desulfofarcimen acetoxidans (strain ATCC 49208 / DSM 771 / KCTC 5769 / VKM B-1644 / 5575) TaxID=485916 RepID=C8VXG8_DESAS|nr:hypothetical protein [Desulfofarcimen acetoxidans]ACV64564.1 hypothetical protein Dtox_3865 [Desulfofarcimen acetoxidans DSM 771]